MLKQMAAMIKTLLYRILLIIFIISGSFLNEGFSQSETYVNRQKRTEWFRAARFGMFIHWGAYAVAGRGEWVRNKEEITIEDYQQYIDLFNPTEYNPKRWAKLAKETGMKYAVMTAKHHDGFCMFDSKYTEYKSTNSPANRDLIREYLEAFRTEGLKVGIYYSLVDWYHPDYPAYGDYSHPMRNNPEWKNRKQNFSNYINYMHRQIEELMTNYGKIDILWVDFSYEEMTGEKWRATDLVKMVRKHQPGILIDNRLGGKMEKENPEIYAGDFEGPEQYIPEKGVINENGYPLPWEACITLNNSWGFNLMDDNWKSPEFIIHTLVNCVSKGGNLLLNVGPDAKGQIPKASVDILKEVGEWMKYNAESIYDCGTADLPKPEWGRFTQKGDTLYGHVLNKGIGHYPLHDMQGKISSPTLLMNGTEVILSDWWLGREKPFINEEDIFFNFGLPVHETHDLPDNKNTVIKIILKN